MSSFQPTSSADSPILHRRLMPSRQQPIDRQIPLQIWHNLIDPGTRPPIAHQISDNSKQRDELDAGPLHARIRRVAHQRRRGPRALDVRKHRVAFCAQRERYKGRAHVGYDAGYDDLLFARGFDGGAELGVVPCAGGG